MNSRTLLFAPIKLCLLRYNAEERKLPIVLSGGLNPLTAGFGYKDKGQGSVFPLNTVGAYNNRYSSGRGGHSEDDDANGPSGGGPG